MHRKKIHVKNNYQSKKMTTSFYITSFFSLFTNFKGSQQKKHRQQQQFTGAS